MFSARFKRRKLFRALLAPPSRLASGENCGLQLCTALRLCTPTGQGAFEPCFHLVARRRFFFAKLKSVHYATLRSLNRLLLSPRPPPNTLSYCRDRNQNVTPSRNKIANPLSGFLAHEYFKSRALRAKNMAAFAYPYAQKPL